MQELMRTFEVIQTKPTEGWPCCRQWEWARQRHIRQRASTWRQARSTSTLSPLVALSLVLRSFQTSNLARHFVTDGGAKQKTLTRTQRRTRSGRCRCSSRLCICSALCLPHLWTTQNCESCREIANSCRCIRGSCNRVRTAVLRGIGPSSMDPKLFQLLWNTRPLESGNIAVQCGGTDSNARWIVCVVFSVTSAMAWVMIRPEPDVDSDLSPLRCASWSESP